MYNVAAQSATDGWVTMDYDLDPADIIDENDPDGIASDALLSSASDRTLRIALDDKISVCWGGVLSQQAGGKLYGFCVEDFCLFFVTKGTLRVAIDNVPYAIEKGHTIMVWPNEEFAGTEPCRDRLSCQWLSFRINRSRPRKRQEFIEVSRVAEVGDFDRIAELFRIITDDYHSYNRPPVTDWKPLSDHGSRLLILSLLARLKTKNPAAQTKTNALTILAERGRDYIRSNFDKPINTEDVAHALECSTRYLRKAFQYSYGYSPSGFILTTRLASARHYLTETRTPISQISTICGFDSPDYFTRVFRTKEGVTPSRYRITHSRKHTVPDV